MPTVEASKKDLEKLCGMKFTKDKLETALLFAKGELDGVEGDTLKIDIKDANRPDLWSIEGISRVIRAGYGKSKGVPKWKLNKSNVNVFIEKSVSKSRPYITCAVVRNVKVTEDLLIQMIQLQEKVGESYGRRRAEVGIGLYDFDKLKPPIYYKGYKPKDLEFVPLEFKVPMKLDEILMEHPKGIKYGHLLSDKEKYPIVIDSENVVASMPPIINSETTGKIDEKTKNIFIECTGFDWEKINVALNVIVSAFLERGAKVETTKIHLPNGKVKITPDFTPGKIKITLDYVNKISGLGLKKNEVVKLLQNSNYDVKISGNTMLVSYPAYRQDILHPIDVVEDVIIAYGYNKIESEPVKVPTRGNETPEAIGIDLVRNVCVGLGLQEILTFTLVSKENQETKMNLKDIKFVEIENPVSENWSVFRKSIIPELLNFLSVNKHAPYPQKLFEIGKSVHMNNKSDTGVAEKNLLTIVITDSKTNFTEIKSIIETIAQNFGWKYSIERSEHVSFEKGKCAAIKIGKRRGLLGEISKDVLKNFNLSMPVSVLEIEL